MNLPVVSLLLALGVASASSAQQVLVAPSAYADTEAPALVGVAGIGYTERQQILVSESHLGMLRGRTIRGIAFRRDTNSTGVFTGGSTTIVVRLAISPFAADAPSPRLTDNAPRAVEVFRGGVVVPTSPSVTGYVGWSPGNVVDIPFSSGFSYPGGTLCIDIEGTVAGPSSFWLVDAVSEPASGQVAVAGAACGPFAGVFGRTAAVAPNDLVVGSSALFDFRGTPGASAYLAVGIDLLPAPIDLAFIGAPGCFLRVNSFGMFATIVGPEFAGSEFGGLANQLVHLPSDRNLLGSSFCAQWLEAGAVLRTSEALVCQISTTPPTLGMSVVYLEPGAISATVDLARAPVIRLAYD